MDTLGLVFENSMKIASDWLTFALDASYVRAVVFGVPIGGHLFMEGLLLVVILFLLSQKSYGPPKRPLTEKRRRRYIVVKAVYENSGQIAPLDEIIRLKEKYRFRVVLDESNSFGVLGSSGRGLTEHCKVPIDKVDIVTAAMGYALATEGVFCTGSTRVIDHQLNLLARLYWMTNIAWAYLIFLSDALFYASFGSASVVLVTSFLLLCLHIYQSAAITVIDVLEGNPDLITKLKKNTSTLYKDVPGLEIMSDPRSPIVFLRLDKSAGYVKGDLKLLEDICDLVLKEDYIFVATSKRSAINKTGRN
ncbi:long chain base biosynthesis 1-like [Olea europaea subsp. europaea]|uniref:serine C-palmitoyltransferase n=1 Tax=Olea europaea subsp. europaea TaxID=158383 RepID=A0A8S0QHQ9_OLEEU|nr:long chain base biosynthesis 1-like [Olea europaea subsp. europaea]